MNRDRATPRTDADACTRRHCDRRSWPRERFGVGALTNTERRVLALLVDGRSNSGIASALGISRRTVESHVSSTYRKLDVASRVSLARVALIHGIGSSVDPVPVIRARTEDRNVAVPHPRRDTSSRRTDAP